MILLELEIENYKQFQGIHLFTPTPEGVVGIIGANGAGKTTLFEAIEWCLYQPAAIKSNEIPPRGDANRRPRVRIRFANPLTKATWEIERKLGKTSASAEIRQLDNDGGVRIIAGGSRAVSQHIAAKMVGLEHAAFVATFFTRQKELSFFGELRPTERRREVGRLLGLETIRQAQELIAEDRRAKQTVAEGLRAQYQHESGERDFEAERAARRDEQTAVDKLIAAAQVELITAQKAYSSAQKSRGEVVQRREVAFKMQTDLETRRGELNAAEAAVKTASDELVRLAELESGKTVLAATFADLANREGKFRALESDRERAQKHRHLTDQRTQAQSESDRLVAAAQAELAVASAQRSIRESEPLREIDDFLTRTAGLDLAATEQRLRQLQALLEDQTSLTKLESQLQDYQALLTNVEAQQTELMARGDPARAEITASDQAANAGQVIATFTANIDAHQKAIADYRIFLDTKREPDHEPICRMCGRAISLEDRDHTRRHAQERIVETEREIDRLNASIVTQRARKEALDLEITESRTRASTLTTLQERVNNGRTKIAETVDQVRHIKASITKQHEELGRSEPVSEQEQSALEQQLTHERDQDKRHAALVPIRASLAAALERIELLSAQLTELGEVAFDPVALETARSALSEAQNAQTRIDSIDEQLMLRAQHKATISFQTPRLDELTVEIGRLSELLAANPVDDLALEKADMELERARQQEQTARGRAEQHRSTRLTIEHAMKQIEFEEKRIEDVARRADDARRDADDLDQMYKEFNAFEQYVSRRVRPQLEDMTSELVRVITENKYESVQYDDNYGIRVWDGIAGAYPIEEFSGGERDVISLSARLALSRLIGSQAANPPSFLVLDEVFGSLDRDRRSNVLELLSSLAGSAESFRQLFVISHIDDVRLSPAFNEVWRVAETADGTSRLENLNLTQGSEDL